MKNDDFLISGEDQDFAMIPYSKITYQLQDEEDEVFHRIIKLDHIKARLYHIINLIEKL